MPVYIASYFTASDCHGKRMAGHKYYYNGSFVAAPKCYKLHSKLIITSRERTGNPLHPRSLVVTVEDRINKRLNRIDLSKKAAMYLIGPNYKVIGVIHVKVKQL